MKEPKMTNDPPSYRLYVAGIILAIYFSIAGYLLYRIYNPGPGEAPVWDQVVFVFNAVGAIATTAAGVLLGVEVQQGNVNAARREARDAAIVSARKDEAVRAALEHLEDNAARGESGASGAAPVSRARLTLQRSLGLGPAVPSD
jgi:hypothetical protein